MGVFKNLKAMKDAATAGMSGQGPSAETLASLTPEQRAAYDAQMARAADAQAEGRQALVAAQSQERQRRALYGPAGEFVYGPDPTDTSNELMDTLGNQGFRAYMKANWNATKPAGQRQAPVPPALYPDRDRQLGHERAVRDQARGPYLAPARFPVAITRIPTRGKDQIDDVVAHLASTGLAGRPELVFGVYRVPDHLGSGLTTQRGRYLEWDVVHAATEALPPTAPPASTFFDADATWVARSSGEPSLLDEDLGLAFLTAVGLGPERTLGIARVLRVLAQGDAESTSVTMSQVVGVQVFHDAAVDSSVFDRMAASRPMALPAGPPAGVHTEVLNWGAVARAVQPQTGHPFSVPSPFPYLPSTPQELLAAYLDIVGVNPFDAYSAQVTEDDARDLLSHFKAGPMSGSTNRGQSQPCADGKDRPRLAGGARVVIVYRDRPEYAEGRQRWAAYEREALLSALDHGTHARRPVEAMEFGSLGGATRKLLRFAEKVADFVDTDETSDPYEKVPPHRYCWPPQDIR